MSETEKQPGKDDTTTGAETEQSQDGGNASEPKSDDDKQPA